MEDLSNFKRHMLMFDRSKVWILICLLFYSFLHTGYRSWMLSRKLKMCRFFSNGNAFLSFPSTANFFFVWLTFEGMFRFYYLYSWYVWFTHKKENRLRFLTFDILRCKKTELLFLLSEISNYSLILQPRY